MMLSQIYRKRNLVWSDEKLGRLYYSTDDRIAEKLSMFLRPSHRVLTYSKQDLSSSGFQGKQYDIVILRSLESIPHRKKLLLLIHRLLVPGGLLLTTDVCMGESISGAALHQWYHERSRQNPLLFYDTFRSSRHLIESSGFHILEEEELSTGVPHLFLAAQRLPLGSP